MIFAYHLLLHAVNLQGHSATIHTCSANGRRSRNYCRLNHWGSSLRFHVRIALCFLNLPSVGKVPTHSYICGLQLKSGCTDAGAILLIIFYILCYSSTNDDGFVPCFIFFCSAHCTYFNPTIGSFFAIYSSNIPHCSLYGRTNRNISS